MSFGILTASELEGPRVNLTYRWISQHIRSCPLTSLIPAVLYLQRRQIWLSQIPVRGVEEIKMTMTCSMVLLVVLVHAFFESMYLMHTRGYVAVITIVGLPFNGEYRDVTS